MNTPDELQLQQQQRPAEGYKGIPSAPQSYDTANYAGSKLFELQTKFSQMTPEEMDTIAQHPEMIFTQFKEFMQDPEFNSQYKDFRSRIAAWQLDNGLQWARNQFKTLETKIPEGDPKRITFTRQGLDSLQAMISEWDNMAGLDLPIQTKGIIQDLKAEALKMIQEKNLTVEGGEQQLALKQIAEIADDTLFNNRIRGFMSENSAKLDAIRKDPSQIGRLKILNRLLESANTVLLERQSRNQK